MPVRLAGADPPGAISLNTLIGDRSQDCGEPPHNGPRVPSAEDRTPVPPGQWSVLGGTAEGGTIPTGDIGERRFMLFGPSRHGKPRRTACVESLWPGSQSRIKIRHTRGRIPLTAQMASMRFPPTGRALGRAV